MGYWDEPEGTDCMEKTWIMVKLGTALGLIGSAYHNVLCPPESVLAGFVTTANATVTLASMGAVFGAVTCISANASETPDDPLHYFIGGCSAGIILGAKTRSAKNGASACLGLGTLAYFTKAGKMEGWRLSGPRI